MAGSASAYADEDDALISDINVTPLVDVVLVVLIVFMITVPTLVALDIKNERDMKVALPSASEATPIIAPPREVIINVDRFGRSIVAGDSLTQAELLEHLRQKDADNPGRVTVRIRADKQCPFEHVMAVMNACVAAGIADYTFSAAEEAVRP